MSASHVHLLPAELAQRSISDREIVLAFADTLTAIDHLSHAGHRILGWEGWLRGPDGRVGHSGQHQGASDLSGLLPLEAVVFCQQTIAAAQAAWDQAPEVPGATLYFCITVAPA